MKKITLLALALCAICYAKAQDVTFTSQNIGGSSNEIGVVDLNGDYLDDVISPTQSNLAIYHQTDTGLVLSNISISASNGPDWSLSVADYDDNGINDIMFGGNNGVSFIKANSDGTSFSQDDQSSIFIFSQRTNFIDINNDGDLDAFVCHDVEPNVYFLNDGSGSFLNEIQGGLGDTPTGHNYGSIWFDYDNDGDSDLYISKCVFGSGNPSDSRRSNQLHRNNGDGTYTEVGAAAGIDTKTQSWSSAVGDFDNDGDMDIIAADEHFNEIGTIFYQNNGDGTFTDITSGSGFENLDGAREIVTFDFNNDGYLDIYSQLQTTLLLNNGDMTFSANSQQISGGGAVGDLNNDGFLDVYSNGSVRMNDGNSNNWLKLNLEGIQSNNNGIGALITIEGGFGIKTRNVRSGEGFANMHSLNPHFGLGDFDVIDTVTIEWPSGITDQLIDIEVNQTIYVEEGSSPLSIQENERTVFNLYPIPANDILNIAPTNGAIIKSEGVIYDLLGKVTPITITNNTVNVSNLATGVYIIEVTTADNKKEQKKFTKL
ncbi:FG-GAP-like repeat-containing protein [Dokdonia sp.]|uniref:FG-GAP-like repeat-containing protein n=1 Tax=Dokdonia sp. TaxID=2024995 RepID=UPI003264EE0D